MKALLEIEQLTVDFVTPAGYVPAIRDVSLRIGAGETVCLVGESGSGKTVTAKALMRLIDFENGVITGGHVRMDGVDLTALPQEEIRRWRGKRIAMVFQEPMAAFDPVFTVGSQIAESMVRHHVASRSEAWERGIGLLRKVGIPEPEIRMKQYPGELSGGMLQRAMIAMALACGPELLIADEPTTALDVTIQAQILQLLQELQSEFNMSILLITHDMGVAAEVADRIIVMYAGEIVEQAAAEPLFREPQHPYTKGLLQSVATLESDRGAKLYSIDGSIPSLSELPGGCRFHPRCPFATEVCGEARPPLADIGGRQVACWHAGALAHSGRWETAFASGASETAAARVSRIVEPEDDEATQPPTTNLIEAHELTRHFPVKQGFLRFGRAGAHIRAVDQVSFSIRKGETFGLVGESGSGKSTLGRLLLQLDRPTSGRVRFDGHDLSKLSAGNLREIRRNMQMIFQDPFGSLNPRWKVGDLIGEPLAVHEGWSGRAKRERVEPLLAAVGLNPAWYDRYPHEFSGGQRQRIGIARAIALRPKFILADEAVSALDVSVQSQIVNLMQDLQRRLGLTYLFIGHGLQIVRYISDRIGVMYLGKLVEIAPSEELFRHPAHHYTRALLASIPVPDPSRKRTCIATQGEIPSPAHPPSGCRFHPRCPAATARCREEEPELTEVGAGRWAACHDPA
ncbi:ABC transporter ATP-binding protein [Paenibacillus tyrfis]|uniref:Peptide ABC transporter ATPase n=1 Tax=Paenibacillus tyrfis TaxID=1501230 RepID=A0A081P2F1_9BACL|nr:ABC transporter ATP-binding protein [Paenibacillus tyrfis]KEQ24874.1 peptide ABC transporter ATPase [Paenibacillus tyrfis]